MPKDAVLTWDIDNQICRWSFENNDIVADSSLLTSVMVSLFTDAHASDEDILPDSKSTDLRGWWGDELNTDLPTDKIGSKLWLLERSKGTEDIIVKAKIYIQEALKWMLTEGIANEIKIETEAQRTRDASTIILAFQVKILKPDGVTDTFRFNKEWEDTANGV